MKTLNLVVATQGHPHWPLAHNLRIPGEIPVTLELGLPSPARYPCRLAPPRNLLRAGPLELSQGPRGTPGLPEAQWDGPNYVPRGTVFPHGSGSSAPPEPSSVPSLPPAQAQALQASG